MNPATWPVASFPCCGSVSRIRTQYALYPQRQRPRHLISASILTPGQVRDAKYPTRLLETRIIASLFGPTRPSAVSPATRRAASTWISDAVALLGAATCKISDSLLYRLTMYRIGICTYRIVSASSVKQAGSRRLRGTRLIRRR